MNVFKNKISIILFSLFIVFTSCKDNEENLMLKGEGEITFAFSKITVYDLSALLEIASLKVVLEKDGEKIIIENLNMEGNDEQIYSTVSPRFAAGVYTIVSYRIFDNTGTLISDVVLEKENQIEVIAGERTTFNIPLKFTSVVVTNNLKNTLIGILRETYGTDSTQWPSFVPNWHPDIDFEDWENLGFSYDDYGNIEYLQSIRFDEKFAGMKKIPEFLSNLITLESIVVENLDLEELPQSIGQMNLGSLLLKNTRLKKLPSSIGLTKIGSLGIINSDITELPDEIGEMEKLIFLTLVGNKFTAMPTSLLNCRNLDAFVFSDSEITSLPEDIFEKLSKVSTFDFSGNKSLSKLPSATPPAKSNMRGLFLDNCGFTEIPASVRNNQLLRTLRMDNNQITKLDGTEFSQMTNLSTLSLNGNSLSEFPKIESESMLFLSLNHTGLKELPDLSGMPFLAKFYCWGNGFVSFPENYFNSNPKMVEARLTPFDSGEFGGYQE
ncbi:MAG: leucine-rich repeat domain-containing protein [Bacteroidales bacterium]